MRISVAQLRGPACGIEDSAVEGYRRDIQDGVPIEPIVVSPADQPDTYTITDGFNRAMAFFLENVSVIEVTLA